MGFKVTVWISALNKMQTITTWYTNLNECVERVNNHNFSIIKLSLISSCSFIVIARIVFMNLSLIWFSRKENEKKREKEREKKNNSKNSRVLLFNGQDNRLALYIVSVQQHLVLFKAMIRLTCKGNLENDWKKWFVDWMNGRPVGRMNAYRNIKMCERIK